MAEGASVIFVSHDIDEVMEITDRATVLRDGALVGVLETRRSTAQDFVERIVGRAVQPFHVHALTGTSHRRPSPGSTASSRRAWARSRSKSARARSLASRV